MVRRVDTVAGHVALAKRVAAEQVVRSGTPTWLILIRGRAETTSAMDHSGQLTATRVGQCGEPPGHRIARSTFEVHRELCEARRPGTPRLAAGVPTLPRRREATRPVCDWAGVVTRRGRQQKPGPP